mmetsp:Transcript_740/g.1431  ORF Transcript_740/g.1431 Transcript_740/m.1431 type:complete len:355 (-) Transcript_740:219-1283(-)
MEGLLMVLASPEILLESNGGLIFWLLTIITTGLVVWPVLLIVLVNVPMDFVILPVLMVFCSILYAVSCLYAMAKRAVRYLLFGARSSWTTSDDDDLDEILDANDERSNDDNIDAIGRNNSNGRRTLEGLFGSSGSNKRFYNSRNRQLFAYQRHIERSLRQRDFESIRLEENAVATNGDDNDNGNGNDNDNDKDIDIDNANGDTSNIENKDNTSNNIVAQEPCCCAICLEEFKASDNDENSDDGNTIVSGPTDCCKSNVFHKRCIMAWLHKYSNDSCPCCRTPMLRNSMHDGGIDIDAGVDIAAEDIAYEAHVKLQLRKRMEKATRRRNEVIAIYLEQQQQEEEQRTARLTSSVD